jgi:hypothetical protein
VAGRSRSWPFALSLIAIGAIALGGCSSPRTAVVVVVETDLAVPAVLASVHVEAGASHHEFDLTGPDARVPFSFGVEPPGGDASRTATLVVEGRDASGSALVTRRAELGFVRGRTLVLHVRLEAACMGVVCAGGTTCVAHLCADDRVDAATLPELVPGHELDPIDAGGGDASDASTIEDAIPMPRACSELPTGSTTGVYTIDPDGRGGELPIEAYCEMTADGGGWTLLAKVNPSSDVLGFHAVHWTAAAPTALGTNSLDVEDALLPSYWLLPVRTLRLVMNDDAGTRSLPMELDVTTPTTLRAAMEPSGSVRVVATLEEWTALAGVPAITGAMCVTSSVPVLSPAASPMVSVRIGITASDDASCAPTTFWAGLGAETRDQGGGCIAPTITAGSARVCNPGTDTHAAFTLLFGR